MSHIIQFQFHKKLCSFREKDVPLYQCDIDGDKEAGQTLKYWLNIQFICYEILFLFNLFRNMLQKGSSEKWPKQLQDFVGTQKMDIQPLLEYFKPLEEYLDQQLKGQNIGWTFNSKIFLFSIN